MTPLIDSQSLAAHCGVARVLVKDEGQRPLGNFKVLGGFYAALKALATAAGERDIQTFLGGRASFHLGR